MLIEPTSSKHGLVIFIIMVAIILNCVIEMFLITSLLEGALNEAVEKFRWEKRTISLFHCCLFLVMLGSSSQALTVCGHFALFSSCHDICSVCYKFHYSVMFPDAVKVSLKKKIQKVTNVRVSDHTLLCEFCFARFSGFMPWEKSSLESMYLLWPLLTLFAVLQYCCRNLQWMRTSWKYSVSVVVTTVPLAL